jgi:hypothetical protein
MSRSVPPPWRDPVPPFWLEPGAPPVTPVTTPFELSPDSCSWIATALGRSKLPPLTKQTIELAISVYKTHIRRPVTAGGNIAAINEALREADRLEKALSRFTDVRRSGVGAKTFQALSPSARELQVSIRKFRADASARKEELQRNGRLGAEHGPIAVLCGHIKFLHDAARGGPECAEKRKQLREFALSVFKAAGIPRRHYYEHPSRLDKFFPAKIQDDPSLAAKLRQDLSSVSAIEG